MFRSAYFADQPVNGGVIHQSEASYDHNGKLPRPYLHRTAMILDKTASLRQLPDYRFGH